MRPYSVNAIPLKRDQPQNGKERSRLEPVKRNLVCCIFMRGSMGLLYED